MLTNEVACERLKEFNDIVEIKKARLACVESLPADLRDIGYSFLDRDSEGNTIRALSPETHEQKFFARQRRVSDLNPDDRRTLFAIFFPRLVPYVERAWNDLGRYPYTIFDTFTYGSFRPCRAPNDPIMMARQRARFIAELVWLTAKYDQSIQWWATWCAYQSELPIRPVLAAAIDTGDEEGEEVYRILEASARGEHEIGRMGQHVPGVLLKSGRREGWELIAKLLKGAGREEGLRQAILESVDLGHPDAFRLFLRLIIEDDLSRFSSVVRALDVWCGLMWDSQAQTVVQHDLALLDLYLNNSDAIRESLTEADDANSVFLALWSAAFDDSNVALELAKPLLEHPDEAVRFAVVVFLCRLGHVGAAEPICNRLSDSCPLVAVHAADFLHDRLFIVGDRIEPLFRRYESLLDRAPEQEEELASLVWPWTWRRWSKQLILEWIAEFTERVPLEWILPHYPAMRADARYGVAKGLKAEKLDFSDAHTRRFVMNMVGDVSVPVCDKGHELLRKVELTEDEVQSLEAYLRRKSSDFRKPVLDLLLRLPERLALESVDRLLASRKAPLRQGGFEVLANLASRKEVSESVRTKVAEVLKEVEREGSTFKKLTGPGESLRRPTQVGRSAAPFTSQRFRALQSGGSRTDSVGEEA